MYPTCLVVKNGNTCIHIFFFQRKTSYLVRDDSKAAHYNYHTCTTVHTFPSIEYILSNVELSIINDLLGNVMNEQIFCNGFQTNCIICYINIIL